MSQSQEDNAEPTPSISDDQVKSALTADKGNAAKLISWSEVPFVNKGDNYICFVTSVEITYMLEEEECRTSYVVKVSTEQSAKGFNDALQYATLMETKYYMELVPALNSVLSAAGQPALEVPRCIYTCSEGPHTMIFMDNLRERGFKMHSRHHGLDADHIDVVMKELAKFNAASLLLQARSPQHDLSQKYHFLKKNAYNITEESCNFWITFLEGHIDIAVLALEKKGGYAKAITFLQSLKNQIMELLQSESSPAKFTVIGHGDCWINNLLFRYSDFGQPEAVALLDFQTCRMISLTCDLNYFFLTSLDGSDRQGNLGKYLDTYYDTLTKVMTKGGMAAPFDRQELQWEFNNTKAFGVLLATYVVPLVISEGSEALTGSEDGMKSFMEKQKASVMKNLFNSPIFKSRFLSMYDDILDNDTI